MLEWRSAAANGAKRAAAADRHAIVNAYCPGRAAWMTSMSFNTLETPIPLRPGASDSNRARCTITRS